MAVGDSFEEKMCDEKSLSGHKLNKLKSCGKCGDDLQWELYENGQLLIFGQGDMYDYSESDSPWYSDRAVITDVEIQEGVMSIGAWAFCGFKKLKEMTIPESVAHIGENAFTDAFVEQIDPVFHVPDNFSEVIFGKGNGNLFNAIIDTRNADMSTKIVALFSKCLLKSAYEEPAYQKVEFRDHEDYPFIYVSTFYDEQGVIRKEYELDSCNHYREIKTYDETGHCTAKMTNGVSLSDDALFITMYIRDSFEPTGSLWMSRMKFKMSLIDLKIQKIQS